ncbi:NADH-ubiquinone oxidoreductase chain 5-like 10, partial [Homarus americanus]
FVLFISSIVLFYRGDYIEGDKRFNRFIYLVLAFVLSIGALIVRPNIIRILLGWDGLGLVSYALVIFYQNEKSANAGILTVLSNRVGDVAILLRISLIFIAGAITKRAQIPFSAWLPAAMAAPTPVSALVHSSTLVTAGVYLLIRFSPALIGSEAQSVLLIISCLTIFIAGLGANFEYDLKKIIALSTLSQLGVILRILALGFADLAFFHLLAHALFKALLFICAGVVIHAVKEYQDIRCIGRLVFRIPLTRTCINLANLALCGIPFLAGFYSKDLILEVAFIRNINLLAFVLYALATGLTVCYRFRLVYYSLTGLFNLRRMSQVNDKSVVMTSSMIRLRIGVLALALRVLGALIGYLLNIISVNYRLRRLKSYSKVVFIGSMWFIPFLSTFNLSHVRLVIMDDPNILGVKVCILMSYINQDTFKFLKVEEKGLRGDYIEGDKRFNRFIYLVLAFVLSIGALIVRPNIIRILLGWDGLGLVSYALVIFYQNEKSANAGILTVLSNRVGDVAILLRISLIFIAGAITKRAQIPFSAWLPAAMAAPTPVSALVHSSTLVTAGVYLLIRFSPALIGSEAQSVLLIISCLTIFIAGLGANFEYDLKKIIALSTLSQLGVILRILALGFADLAFFHLLAHALFKALLFICAGVVIHAVKEYQDIRCIGRLVFRIPLTRTCINLANLALCGIPFLAGFYSKDLILEVAFIRNINLLAFVLYALATGLTVCYRFRLVYYSLTGLFNLRRMSQVNDKSVVMTSSMIRLRIGVLALALRVLGALIGYLLNIISVNYRLRRLKSYSKVVFIGSMWFIPFLSTFNLSHVRLKTAGACMKDTFKFLKVEE